METTSPIEAEIFAAAIEIENDSQREVYLNEACKDSPRLLDRLKKLLKYASNTDCFLDAPLHATELLRENSGNHESVGDVIGPYKLLQKIGEGGMGTVFMADQKEPVKRRVALKVVKPGMDSAQILSRFETERQSLVMMDHPNIARALDVGTTERGRPYFVMELVKGIPISRYCDERRLDTNKRLELFIPVCCAIQHAHLKGIIHRDLKPSNILGRRIRQSISTQDHRFWCGQSGQSATEPTDDVYSVGASRRHRGVHEPRTVQAQSMGCRHT